MTTHRILIFLGALLAALAVVAPAQALASSLLSGYGGPGQGNQAVLGSTLIGGGKGGGSGSSSGGGSSSTSLAEPSTTTASSAEDGSGSVTHSAAGSGSGSSRHGHGAARRGVRSGSTPAARGGDASAVQGAPSAQNLYPAAERIPAGSDSGLLGLSGSDLLYIVLAFVALVFMGVVTVRFGRSNAADRHR